METSLLALYVLREMTIANRFGDRLTLESLSQRIGVRKEDIRGVVTKLDGEDYVDALRMRLTLAGFAVGQSLTKCGLKDLRKKSEELQLLAA